MRPRYPLALLLLLTLWSVALGIAPVSRSDWLLENLIVVIAVSLLVVTHRDLRFSNRAYTCLFAFFVLHEVGAHYTYSLVPYDDWARAVSGTTINAVFGWERNHYDRLLHVLYGVLVLPAVIELLDAKAPPRGVWTVLLPLFFINSHAVIYETIEWLAASVFGGELGQAYLGTQGDVWDAQKDMALAMAGSVLAMAWLTWGRRASASR